MNVTKASLKKSFENGSLPNGEDFSNLIDFFTPEHAFDAHVKAFKAFETAPDVTLGPEGKGWTLALDASHTHVWLAPDTHEPKPRSSPSEPPTHVEADVGLYGWVGMGGRVGTTLDPAALQAAGSEMAGRMPKSAIFKSDGTRQTLFDAPGRPCALEIVAATDRPIATKPPAFARTKKLLGFAAPENAVLHAVATTTAGATPPKVTVSGAPTSLLRTLGFVVLAFALIFTALGHLDPSLAHNAGDRLKQIQADLETTQNQPAATSGDAGATSDQGEKTEETDEVKKLEMEFESILAKLKQFLGGSFKTIETLVQGLLAKINVKNIPDNWVYYGAIVLSLLVGAVIVNRARNAQQNAISVAWVATGAKTTAGADQYRLEVQGPNLARLGGNSNLYVHVTQLWS